MDEILSAADEEATLTRSPSVNEPKVAPVKRDGTGLLSLSLELRIMIYEEVAADRRSGVCANLFAITKLNRQIRDECLPVLHANVTASLQLYRYLPDGPNGLPGILYDVANERPLEYIEDDQMWVMGTKCMSQIELSSIVQYAEIRLYVTLGPKFNESTNYNAVRSELQRLKIMLATTSKGVQHRTALRIYFISSILQSETKELTMTKIFRNRARFHLAESLVWMFDELKPAVRTVMSLPPHNFTIGRYYPEGEGYGEIVDPASDEEGLVIIRNQTLFEQPKDYTRIGIITYEIWEEQEEEELF